MKGVSKIAGMKSLNDDFEKLLSNLEPTVSQRAAIKNHRATIDQTLKNSPELTLLDQNRPSFLTGSYKRSTLIRPINDVDLYVVVHYARHAEDTQPKNVLKIIRKILRNRYPRTILKEDSPCVVVKFADYYFEVVPTYSFSDNADQFAVPNGNGTEWLLCFPNIPQKWLSESNHKNNAKFVPMIKILKQWNREKNIGLKSFHLELITGLVFDHVADINNYPQAIYDWMFYVCRWLHENSNPFISEPGKPGTYVDEYLFVTDRKLRIARYKVLKGLENAQRAYYDYLNGKFGSAKSIYSQLFGAKFPSPAQPKLIADPPKLQHTPPPPQPINPFASGMGLGNALAQNYNATKPQLGIENKESLLSKLAEARMEHEKNKGLGLGILARSLKNYKK